MVASSTPVPRLRHPKHLVSDNRTRMKKGCYRLSYSTLTGTQAQLAFSLPESLLSKSEHMFLLLL